MGLTILQRLYLGLYERSHHVGAVIAAARLIPYDLRTDNKAITRQLQLLSEFHRVHVSNG